MPPRTSRTSRSTTRKTSAAKSAAKPTEIVFAETTPDISTMPAEIEPQESAVSSDGLPALPETPAVYEGIPPSGGTAHSVLLIIGIVVGGLAILGGALFGYMQSTKLSGLTTSTSSVAASQARIQKSIGDVQNQLSALDQRVTSLESAVTSSTEVASSTDMVSSSTQALSSLPVAKSVSAPKSPSGALVRGSFSPDGKRYAGYDVTTVGKKGVAVETIGQPGVRLVVPFNPAVQSSGLGLPQESSMSVRWVDNQTLEYDIIYKHADGTKTQTVETVQVNF